MELGKHGSAWGKDCGMCEGSADPRTPCRSRLQHGVAPMWHTRFSEKAAGLVSPAYSPVTGHMTLPDDSWTRGELELDPSPLCGNFLQPPRGHDGLVSTQEHISQEQETLTFRPHSGLPGRGTALRR